MLDQDPMNANWLKRADDAELHSRADLDRVAKGNGMTTKEYLSTSGRSLLRNDAPQWLSDYAEDLGVALPDPRTLPSVQRFVKTITTPWHQAAKEKNG